VTPDPAKQESAQIVRKQPTLEAIINSDAFQGSLKKYASRIDPSVFASVALTQTRKNPKLLQCTQSSVFAALVRCAELGLNPDGYYAHLIPRKNNKIKNEQGQWGVMECHLSIDYKGLVMLTFRNGELAEPITAGTICKGDVFRHNMGKVLEHSYDIETDRGPIIGAWAIAKFIRGGERHVILNKKKLDRARSASTAGADGPWTTDEDEMSLKTAARNLCKWIPLPPEVHNQLLQEDSAEPIPVRQGNVTAPAALPEAETPEPEQIEEPKGGDLLE